MNPLARFALVAVALGVTASAAFAIVIDGKLDAAYGPPVVVQTTQTDLSDNTTDQGPGFSYGSELDAAYGVIEGDSLELFITGNLTRAYNAELMNLWLPLQLFFDTRDGGQNTLGTANPSPDPYYDLNAMAGLTFDAGFAPDYWMACGAGPYDPPLRVFYGELPTAGGGAGAYLGTSTPGGNGVLSGGVNPFNVEAAIDDRNVGGVTAGCGAASGAGATTGIEFSIPLAALGNPTGCIRVCALVSGSGNSTILNQVLGPMPPGTCDPGAASGVDFGTIPGAQFFTICPLSVPVRPTTWGSLKAIYR